MLNCRAIHLPKSTEVLFRITKVTHFNCFESIIQANVQKVVENIPPAVFDMDWQKGQEFYQSEETHWFITKLHKKERIHRQKKCQGICPVTLEKKREEYERDDFIVDPYPGRKGIRNLYESNLFQ